MCKRQSRCHLHLHLVIRVHRELRELPVLLLDLLRLQLLVHLQHLLHLAHQLHLQGLPDLVIRLQQLLQG
jgi:hypothetical protein